MVSNTRARLTQLQSNSTSVREDVQELLAKQEQISQRLGKLEQLLSQSQHAQPTPFDTSNDEVLLSPSTAAKPATVLAPSQPLCEELDKHTTDQRTTDEKQISQDTVDRWTEEGTDGAALAESTERVVEAVVASEKETALNILDNLCKDVQPDKVAQFTTFIASVTRNITRNPQDEKTYKFSTSNNYIKDALQASTLCSDFIQSLGFTFVSSSRASFFPQRFPQPLVDVLQHSFPHSSETVADCELDSVVCFQTDLVVSVPTCDRVSYEDALAYVATVLVRSRLGMLRELSARCIGASHVARSM
uniref:Uncharacterized protein n=1 Tax=Lygus hesperus TaxID=30085 RepID=A0A0A9X8E3_LYGHE